MLPKVKEYIQKHGIGPNIWSNWVIYPGIIPPGRIAMSEYPYRIGVPDQTRGLKIHPDYESYLDLVKAFPAGVEFICLQEKEELELGYRKRELPEYGLEDELYLAQQITGVKSVTYDNSLEIPDVNVTQNTKVHAYVMRLLEAYKKGQNFVIHCMGGHGRTGVVAGLLLGYILADQGQVITASELLQTIQACHDQRQFKNGWTECPQTWNQKDQITGLYEQQLKNLNLWTPSLQSTSKWTPSLQSIPKWTPSWHQSTLRPWTYDGFDWISHYKSYPSTRHDEIPATPSYYDPHESKSIRSTFQVTDLI